MDRANVLKYSGLRAPKRFTPNIAKLILMHVQRNIALKTGPIEAASALMSLRSDVILPNERNTRNTRKKRVERVCVVYWYSIQ
jgi:hypothetical protein